MSNCFLNNVFENSRELLPSPYDELDHLQPSIIPAHIQIQQESKSSKECSNFIYGICFPDEDKLIENDYIFDYDDSFMDYIMAELMKHRRQVGSKNILEIPLFKEKPSLIQSYLES
ncbi:hypothetical protein RYX36_012410 [Vicia faba]